MGVRDQFEKEVQDLLELKELLPVETRIKQVTDLTEWYWKETGKVYKNSYFLDLLGTYLLADELRNKSTHKVKQTDFPILSHTQLKLRNRRERRVGDENIDFIILKEVKQHPNAFKTKTQNKDE
ncbi:hypothetical protein QFZ31_006712 [Neobacillus niacini]|uniref:hypothetical protein n=1 Tax=Neobacillus driksii TaxID=3035913 RepID=UPI0027859FB9|nr:hypothetical protein [Neobacillus niacini]MDQ0976660.1 hypothetical protein [Neobacillus niacini]